jgi:hypothetical protein
VAAPGYRGRLVEIDLTAVLESKQIFVLEETPTVA